MGLSYKAVESLLSRARAYVRAAVASAWVLVARVRRRRVDVPADVPVFAMGAIVTIAALAPGGPAPSGPGTPPPSVALYAAAPLPARAARPTLAPATFATFAKPVPRTTAAGSTPPAPPRPKLPLPTAVPTDPCDVRAPFVSTCVPLHVYQPGEGLRRCLRDESAVAGGVNCWIPSTPKEP